MQFEVTSKHLRSATELMLLIPVKSGFVEGTERLTSFATRLSTLLNGLSEPRRIAAERDGLLTADPIDSLQSIYATQWGVVERPQGSLLIVASSFDRSWEDYFHILVQKTGPLLDAIFCHCEGYAGHTCVEAGYERFSAWIRRHQVPCSFFFMSAPDLTTDDLRYARRQLASGGPAVLPGRSLQEDELQTRALQNAQLIQQLQLTPVQLQQQALAQAQRAVTGLFELSRLFPEIKELEGARTARIIFEQAANQLLQGKLSDPLLGTLQGPVSAWVRELRAPEKREPGGGVNLDLKALESIQGNILEPFPGVELTHGCVLLVQCDDANATRKLLGRLNEHVTSAQPDPKIAPDAPRINLALTYAGLKRLALPDEVLASLPKEFKEGMAERAAAVGDLGLPNHPDYWKLPEINWPEPGQGEQVSLSAVDVVLIVQAQRPTTLGDHNWSRNHPLYADLHDLGIEGDGDARILHVQPLRRYHLRGHFDMPEGGSQPSPNVKAHEKYLANGVPPRDVVPLGELLLGHPNRHGDIATCAQQQPDLFHNGSFMVLRQLEQDVEAFESFLDQNAHAAEGDRSRLKAWVVGRDEQGRPLTPGNGGNDFDYAQDPGIYCPFHAHIRRANPRTKESIPRIMRRSFSYGCQFKDAPGEARGLLFMAYNASIATQFEVIQRWLNGGNSTGMPSAQNDLLSGSAQCPGSTRWFMQNGAWKGVAAPDRPVVALRWGLYLFVPSKKAITELAERAPAEAPPGEGSALVTAGQRLIGALDAIKDDTLSNQAWKQVVEADPVAASAVWAAVRVSKAPKPARNYGLLVGDVAGARKVLANLGDHYSVREYWRRLGGTIGGHYLARDPKPVHFRSANPQDAERDADYEAAQQASGYYELAKLPNDYFATLAPSHVYDLAQTLGREELRRRGPNKPIDLRRLAKLVVARVAAALIGIPKQHAQAADVPAHADPDERADADAEVLLAFIEHFIVVSRYSFQPYPDRLLKQDALDRGAELRDGYATPANGPMAEFLRNGGYAGEEAIKLAVIGAIVGFAAPAVGSFLSVLSQWLESGELWRLTYACRNLPRHRRRQPVLNAVIRTLIRAPVPSVLYRTALPGNPHDAKPGSLVVVGLQATVQDAIAQKQPLPQQWLFGGAHGTQAQRDDPPHGCPARDPAQHVLAGLSDALLGCMNLKREPLLAISYEALRPDLSAVQVAAP